MLSEPLSSSVPRVGQLPQAAKKQPKKQLLLQPHSHDHVPQEQPEAVLCVAAASRT